MKIGEPERVITIEPIEDPVPAEQPVEQPEQPEPQPASGKAPHLR